MKIVTIFSPKNVLIAFVALTIFHIIVGQTVYVRGIEALLLSSFFLLSHLAIFVISIINCMTSERFTFLFKIEVMKMKINKRKIAVILLTFALFTSCAMNNEPPEIVEIPGTSRTLDLTERFGGLVRNEHFVIFNHPETGSLELLELINDFNRETLCRDMLLKYRSLTRIFYRKTKCVMRVYTIGERDATYDTFSRSAFNLLDRFDCGGRATLVSISWNVGREQRINVSYYISNWDWRQTWRYDSDRVRHNSILNASDDELFNLRTGRCGNRCRR